MKDKGTILARDSGDKCSLMGRDIYFGSLSCVLCEYYIRHTMHTLDCGHPHYKKDKKE